MMEGRPGADSEEKREPVSDIDTAVADSLKVLDLKRPIREADIVLAARKLLIRSDVSGMRTMTVDPARTNPSTLNVLRPSKLSTIGNL
jgi:hypothetical protein